MRARRTITTAVAAATALLTAACAAQAAGPGETFLVGGLPLPAGAVAGGDAGRGEDERIAVSANGRYVAFVSLADGLSPEAGVDVANVFRKDRQTGEVVFVSRADGAGGAAANRSSREVTISADGSRVGFVTEAALDPGDSDGVEDLYLRDVATGRTLLMSGGIATAVTDYDLSGNGAFVAFTTDAAIGEGNTHDDVYRRQIDTGVTTLVSAVDGSMTAADATANMPSISDDGNLVAFTTTARNLGFTSAGYNVVLRDVANSRTALVSHPLGFPGRGGNEDSFAPSIAGGATALATAVVGFESLASNLTGVPVGMQYNVYAGTTATLALVSRADGVNGASSDHGGYGASVANDGRRVAFSASATNLGGTTDAYGAYVRELASGRTVPLSGGSEYAVAAAISGDGGYVAWFDQDAGVYGLDPGLYQVVGRIYAPPPAAPGAVEELSRPAGSAPWVAPAFRVSTPPTGGRAISGDGRYVVLTTGSRHLHAGGTSQVYRRDTLTGALELVSRRDGAGGAALESGAYEATISADGNRVAFATEDAIDPADGGADNDIYVRDVAAGTTTLASRADGPGGAPGDRGAANGRIAPDGGHVAFVSTATNFGPLNGRAHVYLRDLTAGTTALVDRADGDGAPGNADASDPSVSADGSRVAFRTNANNLDPADPAPDTTSDIYVRDLRGGDTQLVSRRSGADGVKATQSSFQPAISGDGRVVAFVAYDETLAPEAGAWPVRPQIVARDLGSQQTSLVSRVPGGAPADSSTSEPSIDATGERISFASSATNLLPGLGGDARSSVFVRTTSSGALAGPPAFGLPGNDPQNRSLGGSLSLDGQCLLFLGLGHNAVTGAAGDIETAYVHTLSGSCPKPLPQARGPDTTPPRRPDGGRAAPVRPVLSRVSLLRARFRVATGATALTAAARRGAARRKKPRRTPAGTAIRFTLNARANVTIAIERNAGRGRLVGRSCRRATRKLRRKRACTRWTKVGALSRKGVEAGRRSVAFSGRLGRRALAPGGYRLTVKAANAAGSSKPATLAFTVVRR